MFRRGAYLLWMLTACLSGSGQVHVKKVSLPPGNTLEKAAHASTLGQPGAKPFHIRVEITQTKGPQGAYAATVEETWISAQQWVRTVSAVDFNEKTVVDAAGTHVLTKGDYYPMWLRNFVEATFSPVRDLDRWHLNNAPIEYLEFPNGKRSTPCQRAEFPLGVAPHQQVNFANECFRWEDGMLDLAQAPTGAMEFHDYVRFGDLRIARTLVEDPSRGIELTGKVVTLEVVKGTDPHLFAVPEGASGTDPLASLLVSAESILQLSSGTPALQWPAPIPGSGMFTAWVSLDTSGRVREAHSLNSDESGLAGDMTSQLVGKQWKRAMQNGRAVQAEGPVVFTYPPSGAQAAP